MDDSTPARVPVDEGAFECPDVAVGHAAHPSGSTGCTVMVLPRACPYAVHVGGGASSLRQVAALVPGHSVTVADAFLVTGGSAYGLDAAGGVLAGLEARGRGTVVGRMRVPAVPTVALFDLYVGDPDARPDQAMGAAALAAARVGAPEEGRVGAASAASVGKILGVERASWGGLAVATVRLDGGLVVSALAVVNAFGSVVDPRTGGFVAGPHDGLGGFVDTEEAILAGALAARFASSPSNTTIGLIVTNGRLDGDRCSRAAWIAAQAMPMCLRPAWTAVDGDTVFLAATGEVAAEPHAVGIAGREALMRAIVRAVTLANVPGSDGPGALRSGGMG
jgi:L-aminopeptidase/D-esterase-like protein